MDRLAVTHQLVYLLAKEKLGRRSLAQRTGLTEMTVRLELERLRDKRWVTLAKSGVTLTNPGRQQFAALLAPIKAVQELSLTSLALDEISLAALVSRRGREGQPAWWYRDHAVREGASAMVMLRYATDGWRFAHDMERIGIQNARDERAIEAAFPERGEGDLLIIVSASDRRCAGLGLWRVITELLFPSA